MPIERLTAEDELMLWPDEIWPQDIGALVLMDGATLLDAAGQFRIEAATQAVEARLHLVPRFRQILRVPERRLGGPLWIDATSFDIRDHLHVLPVPAPGDEMQLLATVEAVRRRRLERSRPLWEMWFLTGLPARRIALFVRMHHCIADGMAGVATMARFLDVSSDVVPAAPEPWTAAPAPTERELLDDRQRRRREAWRARLSRLGDPAGAARQALAAWRAISELVASKPGTATSLDRLVGQDRRLALIRNNLGLVKKVAHTYGATVNDVLLDVTAGGLRRLLSSRNEAVEDLLLRIYVPISLHLGSPAEARGNLISQMVVPLPIGVADPIQRLHQIARDTAARKVRSRPSLGIFPHRGVVGRVFLKLVARQRVNVGSADIPGPQVPLYFAGARLLEVFPLAQLLGNETLAIGAMSYAGQFNMMVLADRDTYPDLEVFTAGVIEELDWLEASIRPGLSAGVA